MKVQQSSIFKSTLGTLIWLGFAAVFFYSGLYFTEWVLQTEEFAGGWRWILVVAFPFLVPGFFVVNRRYGCASGGCVGGSCHPADKNDGTAGPRMPLA